MERHLMYEGKAKKIFSTPDLDVLEMEFKDNLTAFNAQKRGEFVGKGELNCRISTIIFKLLNQHNIPNHWIETVGSHHMRVKKTTIIPLEVVVRNFIAGSFAKKLGLPEGEELAHPVVEYYYKADSLNDPFVNEDHVTVMGWATAEQLNTMKRQALKINRILRDSFFKVGLKLVDFKVEFGTGPDQQLILADELSPDCMRIWDLKTNNKLDKDRFRLDLGSVDKAYSEVYTRLNEGRLI